MGDQIKRNKMDRACSMDGGGESSIQSFGGNPDGKKCFGRLGTEGRIILKWILKLFWRMWPGML
jgi:hypothetical protein